jgi:hypothetical protein
LSQNAPERRSGTSPRAAIEGRMGDGEMKGAFRHFFFSQFNVCCMLTLPVIEWFIPTYVWRLALVNIF